MNKFDLDALLRLPPKSFPKPTKPFVIYGAGFFGTFAINYLSAFGLTPLAVCDANRSLWDTELHGCKVMGLEQALAEFKCFDIIIASHTYYQEIKDYCLRFVSESRIIAPEYAQLRATPVDPKHYLSNYDRYNKVYCALADEKSRKTFEAVIKIHLQQGYEVLDDIYDPNQYFCDILPLTDHECFVDAGAYTGDTLEIFTEKVGGKFLETHSFEPFSESYQELEQLAKDKYRSDPRIKVYNAGLYSEKTNIGFSCGDITTGASVSLEGAQATVSVVKLDEVVTAPVTFIKMDIEGSELAALKGAEQTIKKHHPNLAICVYHKTEDILEIPEFIMSLGVPYKYYLRHHSERHFTETVLYAICEENCYAEK